MATIYVSNQATNGYVVGSDSNAGTSPRTAKATLSGAQSAASNGDTLLFNDGTYDGAAALTLTKTVTINCEHAYLTILTCAASTTYIVKISPAAGGTITIGNLRFDGLNICDSLIYVDAQATKFGLTLNATSLHNAISYHVDATTATNFDFSATGCFSKNDSTLFISAYQSGIALVTGSIFIDNWNLKCGTTNAAATSVMLECSAGAAIVTCTVQNCFLRLSGVGGGKGIHVQNCKGALIDNNDVLVEMSGTGLKEGIVVEPLAAGPVDMSGCRITNNKVTVDGPGGGLNMRIGTDGTGGATDNLCNSCIVAFNTITCGRKGSGQHSVLYGSNKHGKVYGNIIKYSSIGLGVKLMTGDTVYSGNIVMYPGIGGTGQGSNCVFVKGCTGVKVINNSFWITSSFSGTAMYCNTDSDIPTFSTNILFQNNNVYCDILPRHFVNIEVGHSATFINNNYFIASQASTTGASDLSIYGATNYATAQAFIDSRDVQGTIVDPLFLDVTRDLKLSPNSPLIHAGKTAPAGVVVRDFRGRPFYTTPTVGAYEFTSGDLPAQTRAKRN